MPVDCPICNPSAQELPRTGDVTDFHCPTHGDFKVANTVFEVEGAKDCTRKGWEGALDKAKQRTEEEEDGWPLIITDDFY